jgi:hypothetical protein
MLLWILSQSALADCPDTSNFARKCFDNSNAPPELVFRIFTRSIFREAVDYLDDLDALDEDEYHAGWDIIEVGLTPEMRSADVARYFVTRYLPIEREVEELSKLTLCIDDKPRYEGAENFVIFNQMEEISLNVYQKHLLIARADLQASGLFDIDKALDEIPISFGSTFMDHEKAHNGSAAQIYEFAKGLCMRPWGHQFSSSVRED